MTKEDIKTIIDIVHKTIYGFFDVCDEEETPMTDKDNLLLKINKAICTNIKALEQEPTTKNGLGVDWDELKRKILMEVDGGTDDRWLCYADVCDNISNSIDDFKADLLKEA